MGENFHCWYCQNDANFMIIIVCFIDYSRLRDLNVDASGE